ncbi:uncharacterized protein LOC118805363 [Colossoma macropomum]|uniref:uncharacterized protein LOC118805363 n=1 Tax=Colossoma macropomum TaxID=42526 RepID=UPI001863BA76|nr:uncharacterized protein LOC118805363 [Colossoma macropomum]
MNQIRLSEVLVKNSIAAVISPLKDGLWSINKVYEALIDGDVDPISGRCANYKHSRKQIVQAKKNLERSEQAAGTGLRSLDENIEILTRDMGKLEQEMKDTKQKLDNLRTEQTSNENLLKQSERSVEQSRRNLNSARDTLRKQQERKRNAKVVTGVGLGLTLIPIVGWIAGPAMAIGGAMEIDEATHAAEIAEEEVRSSESQVEKYRSKVSEYKQTISQTEGDIKQKRDKVEQIRNKIQKVKEQREAIADFQKKVRKAVHVLSGLSGKARVAETQTRRFIFQKPVMKVMEDLMKAAGEITGNQLLSAEGIPKLISEIKENNRKLAAICASASSAEHEGYY